MSKIFKEYGTALPLNTKLPLVVINCIQSASTPSSKQKNTVAARNIDSNIRTTCDLGPSVYFVFSQHSLFNITNKQPPCPCLDISPGVDFIWSNHDEFKYNEAQPRQPQQQQCPW